MSDTLVKSLFFVGFVCYLAWRFFVEASREEKQRAASVQEEARRREELQALRRTPTSSPSSIRGHKIVKQIKLIAVDNHHYRDDADRAFFKQVQACGGNGVINMRVRRHRGGYVSIQGDTVVLREVAVT